MASPPRVEKSHYALALREARTQTPNYQLVLRNLSASVRRGDGRAAWALYTWYRDGFKVEKNLVHAIELLKRAADTGLPEALFDLAVHYECASGVRRNLREAFVCYLRAALVGNTQSIHEIGRCYYYGIGVRRDRKIAVIWLKRAYELGIHD